ncbi:MAG: endosialidase [Lachnospiraceae bacterium]|nr:endosialidase [Lachnospiraceae bacterium]
MSAVKELIRTEADGTISFGDYELENKTKKSDYEFEGDLYKVKTFKEITRLEKNEMFIYESEPGTAVLHLSDKAEGMEFSVEGPEDAQITVEGEPETEYDIYIEGVLRDTQKSNLGGKISFSVELDGVNAQQVKLIRKA